MRSKTLLSAVFTSLGVVMLVAAIFASTAISASKPAAKPTSKSRVVFESSQKPFGTDVVPFPVVVAVTM